MIPETGGGVQTFSYGAGIGRRHRLPGVFAKSGNRQKRAKKGPCISRAMDIA
jgi:hypothetical protein